MLYYIKKYEDGTFGYTTTKGKTLIKGFIQANPFWDKQITSVCIKKKWYTIDRDLNVFINGKKLSEKDLKSLGIIKYSLKRKINKILSL